MESMLSFLWFAYGGINIHGLPLAAK